MVIGVHLYYLEYTRTQRHTDNGNIKPFSTVLENVNKQNANTVFTKNMISFKN